MRAPLLRGFITATVLTFVGACRSGDPELGTVRPSLESSVTSVALPTVFVGARSSATFALRVRGDRPVVVRVEGVASPFEVSLTEALSPGETTVGVSFAPIERGQFSQPITIRGVDGQHVDVVLEGLGLAVPDCESNDPCTAASFDVELGRCVTKSAPDGTSCKSACIAGGTCVDGQCAGATISCDDGNACTTDSCSPASGCSHRPVECPSADACNPGICNPVTGCFTAPAADGTSCGSSRSCDNADVCVSGQCVQRPPPDGFVCAPATPCQGEGRCEAGLCNRPEVSPLTGRVTMDYSTLPRDTYDFVASDDGGLVFFGFGKPVTLLDEGGGRHVPGLYVTQCIVFQGMPVCVEGHGTFAGGDVAVIALTWSGEVVWRTAIQPLIPATRGEVARLFLAERDENRLMVLAEAVPPGGDGGISLCRRFSVVHLGVTGAPLSTFPLDHELLQACRHLHPVSIAVSEDGYSYLSFGDLHLDPGYGSWRGERGDPNRVSPFPDDKTDLKLGVRVVLSPESEIVLAVESRAVGPVVPIGRSLVDIDRQAALDITSGRTLFEKPAIPDVWPDDIRFDDAVATGERLLLPPLGKASDFVNTHEPLPDRQVVSLNLDGGIAWLYELEKDRVSDRKPLLGTWAGHDVVLLRTFHWTRTDERLVPEGVRAISVDDGREVWRCPVRGMPEVLRDCGYLGAAHAAVLTRVGIVATESNPPECGRDLWERAHTIPVPSVSPARRGWPSRLGGASGGRRAKR